MTAKGKNTEIISISISKKMGQEIDTLSQDVGYSTRSELIRDAIRLLIKSKTDIDKIKGKVEGAIFLLFKQGAELDISKIKHDNSEIIKTDLHYHFSEKKSQCCEIMIFTGVGEKIRKIINDLKTIKNVEEVHVFIA